MSQRILIAGASSGSGKTTITLALLAALKARGLKLASAKCGPDYVDPALHRELLGISSYNLDAYFLDRAGIRAKLARSTADCTLIEGVMGYYDGSGADARGSSYQIAQYTETPAVIVVQAKGMYQSLAALLQGFAHYRQPSYLSGVIFNGVSAKLAPALAQFAEEAGLQSLGVLPYQADIHLEEGRLGLNRPPEEDLSAWLARLGELAEAHLDLDLLLKIAATAPALPQPPAVPSFTGQRLRLAIAKDAAFNKLYPDNLEALENAGFELCYFSPLRDAALPEQISALYLPGGEAEDHATVLAARHSLLAELRHKLTTGLPCLAEHSGAAYLYESLNHEPLLGVLRGEVSLTSRLQNFGYAEMQALTPNFLCPPGESLAVHEYHYYQASNPGSDLRFRKASGKSEGCRGFASPSLFASFAQLYFPAYPHILERFYQAALAYSQKS